MLSNLGLIYQERTYAHVVSNNSRNTKTIGNAYPRSGTVTDNTYHRLGNETYPHRRPDNKNNQPTCHFCGVPGHMKNQCRFGDYLRCFSCKAYGHKSKYCPN